MRCPFCGHDETQVKDNIRALDFKLSDNELSRINKAVQEFELVEA